MQKGELRITHQRRVILEELREMKTDPTADELYERVRRRLPRISLGTVYRNLEILSEVGMIQKLETGGRQMRFDGNTSSHFHIRCTGCGRVDDVEAETEGPVVSLVDSKGYKILGYRLEFEGLCPKCQQ